MHTYIHTYILTSIHTSIHPSIHPSNHPPTHPPINQPTNQPINQSINAFVRAVQSGVHDCRCVRQIWTDVGLQWDPDKYGGIRVVRVPYDEVWRPDILLYNK